MEGRKGQTWSFAGVTEDPRARLRQRRPLANRALASALGALACPLGVLRVGERPADAFNQLRREVGVVDVGRADALFELKGTSVVAKGDAVLGVGVGHDDDACHVLLAFGWKLVHARDDQASTNALGGSAGRLTRRPPALQTDRWRGTNRLQRDARCRG